MHTTTKILSFLFLVSSLGACATGGPKTAPTEETSGTSEKVPGDPPAADESTGSATGTATDEPDSTGPIALKNLSFSVGGTSSTPRIVFDFALANTGSSSIYKIQEVTLTSGSSSATYSVNCSPDNWNVYPGETTGVVEMTLSSYSTMAELSLGYPCSGASGDLLQAGDTIRVDVKGLFSDASQWKAHATATR